MMMGPEPMMRIFLMSVRLGMVSGYSLFQVRSICYVVIIK